MVFLEPDLIIGSKEDDIENYQKIGIIVFLPYWTGKTTAGPLEKFRSVSEIFGKEKEAEAWITEYEKKVAEARKKIEGIIKEGETFRSCSFLKRLHTFLQLKTEIMALLRSIKCSGCLRHRVHGT